MANHSAHLRRWASQGWEAEHLAGGHIRLRHPDSEKMIVTAKTPSDWRAIQNTESLMRRSLPTQRTGPEMVTESRQKRKPAVRVSENFSFDSLKPVYSRFANYRFAEVVEENSYEPEINYLQAFVFMLLRMRVSGHSWDVIRIQKSRYRRDVAFRSDVITRLEKADPHEFKKLRVIFLANAKAKTKTSVEVKQKTNPPKMEPVKVKTEPKKIEPVVVKSMIKKPVQDDDQPCIPDDYINIVRSMQESKFLRNR